MSSPVLAVLNESGLRSVVKSRADPIPVEPNARGTHQAELFLDQLFEVFRRPLDRQKRRVERLAMAALALERALGVRRFEYTPTRLPSMSMARQRPVSVGSM
jgi:hypothetical protein